MPLYTNRSTKPKHRAIELLILLLKINSPVINIIAMSLFVITVHHACYQCNNSETACLPYCHCRLAQFYKTEGRVYPYPEGAEKHPFEHIWSVVKHKESSVQDWLAIAYTYILRIFRYAYVILGTVTSDIAFLGVASMMYFTDLSHIATCSSTVLAQSI